MEQQEKKKRRTQSRSTFSFPIDLTTEILLRMPEKSVVRFRCVSKLWSSITTDPYFINLYETRFPRPSLLLCFKNDDNFSVSSIPQHTHSLHKNSNKSYSSSQPIDRYQIKLPEECSSFCPTESVHGLVCFQESGKPIVWNPSKRQFFTVSKPDESWNNVTLFLGYDPIEGKHKVVCMLNDRSCDVCRVLTLGSARESWRTVKTDHKHRSYFVSNGRCIKGVIYFLAYIYHTHVWDLMSFDVRSEIFDMIKQPSDVYMDTLIDYGGRLACIAAENNGGGLWILEDAGKHKWSSLDFLAPFVHYFNSLRIDFRLKGFTHAGEFIYVPITFRKSFYILFYDPVRNCCRRFEFDGIAEDEHWLNNGRTYVLHAFPNHIDG